MFKYIMSKKDNEKGLIGIILCIITFIVGHLVLKHISTMEHPPVFGNTVYILIGSTFVFTSALGAVLIVKYLYDAKKRRERKERKRRNHKIYYLDKKNKTENDQNN
ncbi:hypothetical protein [Flavobacterium sp. XGLA_31]|uniref:hypothetical protein n=1 Tax=Flavobacterium sp. XGLA_31 TaxID=3447666 RepID=UPI003F3AFBC9